MTRPSIRPAALTALAAIALAVSILASGDSLFAQDEKKPAAAAAPKEAKPKPKAPLPADDKAILPFLTDEAFIVGRLDADRVDVGAIERYLTKVMEASVKEMELEPDEAKEMTAEVDEIVKTLRAWFDGFTEAGGRQIYVFIDHSETLGDGEPMIVAPLGKGADAVKMGEKFRELAEGGETVTAELGEAVVFGSQAQIDGMRQHLDGADGKPPAAPAERPDLAKAFAAAGDAPLRLAFVPSGEAGREYMEETFTDMAEEVGEEGDGELLAQGIKWVTVAVTQEPSLGVTLTMRAADADRAERLEALLNKLLAFVREQQEPDDEDGAKLVKQLDAIKPKRQGETVTVDLDAALLPIAALGGLRAEGEIEVDGDEKPDPAKPDDGGL